MNTTESTQKQQLVEFGQAYDYDTSYLVELLEASPGAFAPFTAAQGMAEYRDRLPLDAHFVARISAMQSEDCGACGQLNLRMAAEAGVDRDLLRTLIEDPARLPGPLRDVRDQARRSVAGGSPDPELAERLRRHYGADGFAELAVLITGCRIYPGLKRALSTPTSCEMLTLDF